MRTTTYVTRLNHDPQFVSAFLSDLRNDVKWRREVVASDVVSGTPGESGARYEETVNWEGATTVVTLTATEVIAGSRLVIRSAEAGYESLYEYQFAPINGGTEVTLFMSIATSGPLKVVEPLIWTVITRWVERDLNRADSFMDEPLRRDAQVASSQTAGLFDSAGEMSRAFVGEVIDRLAEGIVLYSTHGRVFYANNAVEEMLEIPRESVLGRRHDDPAFSLKTLEGRPLPAGETPFERVRDTGEPLLGAEYRADSASGRVLVVSVNAVPLTVGSTFAGVAVSATDVTDRTQAEARVKFQSRLLDEVRNAVVATDVSGTLTYANDEAQKLLGREGNGVVGRGIMDVVKPAAVHRDSPVMQQVMTEGRWEGEATFTRSDGRQVPVLLTLGQLLDDHGRPEGFIGVAADITEIKEAERNLQEKDTAIRRAYVDVLSAVTGGKLVLLTADEMEEALGKPMTPEMALVPDTLAESRSLVFEQMALAGTKEDPETGIVAYSEAATNALRHAGKGRYQLFRKDGAVQVGVFDTGPGIDFRMLPKATLVPGFSSAETLGMGFTIMLNLADRVLLATAPGYTQVALEFGVKQRVAV